MAPLAPSPWSGLWLKAASMQHPWAEAKGTLPKVPMQFSILRRPSVLAIAVRDEAGSLAHTIFIQGCVWSFSCLSIEH